MNKITEHAVAGLIFGVFMVFAFSQLPSLINNAENPQIQSIGIRTFDFIKSIITPGRMLTDLIADSENQRSYGIILTVSTGVFYAILLSIISVVLKIIPGVLRGDNIIKYAVKGFAFGLGSIIFFSLFTVFRFLRPIAGVFTWPGYEIARFFTPDDFGLLKAFAFATANAVFYSLIFAGAQALSKGLSVIPKQRKTLYTLLFIVVFIGLSFLFYPVVSILPQENAGRSDIDYIPADPDFHP